MNPDRLDELWTRHLAGEGLRPEDEAEMIDAFETDEAWRNRHIDDARLDGWLKGLSTPDRDAEGFARRFRDCLEAQRDESRFIRKVRNSMTAVPVSGDERKPTRRKPVRRIRSSASGGAARYLIPALAAAGVVLAILWAARTPFERRPVVVKKHERTVPPPPVPVVRASEQPADRIPLPAPAVPSVAPKGKPAPPERPRERRTPAPKAPTPAPAPPRPSPAPATTPSEKAIALLEEAVGTVEMRIRETSSIVRRGSPLPSGVSLETTGPGSRAAVRFPDGTLVVIEESTRIETLVDRPKGPGGKSFRLTRGTLEAQVTRQPAGRPLVITLPNATATVLGTTFRLAAGKDRTHLEVHEGRVRLKRALDGRPLDVAAGFQAVVAPGVPFKREPIEAPVFQEDFTTLPLNAWPEGWKPHRDSTEIRSGFRVLPDRSRRGNRLLACTGTQGGATQHAVIPLDTYPDPVEFLFRLRLSGGRNSRAGIELEDGEVLPSVEIDAQAGVLRVDWPRGRVAAEKKLRIPADTWSLWSVRVDREGIHVGLDGRTELQAKVPGFTRVTGASLISRGADTAEYDDVRVVRRLPRRR